MEPDLFTGYMQEVLGYRILPSHSSALPAEKFGVFLGPNGTTGAGHELLAKMLKAIGVESFSIVKASEDSSAFEHLLDFSGTLPPFTVDRGQTPIVWRFHALSNFIEASAEETAANKKEAWEMLKTFRSEVLS